MSILLKISKEENVESLLSQIQEVIKKIFHFKKIYMIFFKKFISELSDEFKVDIVRCIRGLVRKHPKKSKVNEDFNTD